MNGAEAEPLEFDASERDNASHATAPLPGALENRILRQAVQENLVSFPSQVPVFQKLPRPDLQQKLVVLYFVCGWTMDDIAVRYGLGRQRMGQILTAWRVRAVKEGYIQANEPAHPLFRRVQLESSSIVEMPLRITPVVARATDTDLPSAASDLDEPGPARPAAAEAGGLNLPEQLHTIVGILENQFRLCSKPFGRNIESCEPLLARARTLCGCLEAQLSPTEAGGDPRITAVISAAQTLFERFHRHAAEHCNQLPCSEVEMGTAPDRGIFTAP